MSDLFFEYLDVIFFFCLKFFNVEVVELVESDLVWRLFDGKKVIVVVVYSVVWLVKWWYVIKISCFSKCVIVEWSIEVWIILLLI